MDTYREDVTSGSFRHVCAVCVVASCRRVGCVLRWPEQTTHLLCCAMLTFVLTARLGFARESPSGTSVLTENESGETEQVSSADELTSVGLQETSDRSQANVATRVG